MDNKNTEYDCPGRARVWVGLYLDMHRFAEASKVLVKLKEYDKAVTCAEQGIEFHSDDPVRVLNLMYIKQIAFEKSGLDREAAEISRQIRRMENSPDILDENLSKFSELYSLSKQERYDGLYDLE